MKIAVCAAVIAAASIAGGCASSGAVPRPFPGAAPPPGSAASGTPVEPAAVPEPEPAAAPPVAANETAAQSATLIATALALRGIPYRNGGHDPAGFDCSGFVQYVFAQHGHQLPRETQDQFRAGSAIGRDDVRPGDLVFFETVRDGPSHVGIALGADEFVHAPSSRGVVRVERYTSGYWAQRWVGARRITE